VPDEEEQWLSLETGLSQVRSEAEFRAFLTALCSRTELTNLRHRWEAFQRVRAGQNQPQLRRVLGFGKITAGRCVEAVLANRDIIETIVLRSFKEEEERKS
jgi:uncharacterized protein YerC